MRFSEERAPAILLGGTPRPERLCQTERCPNVRLSNAPVCRAVAVGVVWYCSGLGYVMSVMLEPQNSMVASVAIVLVLGGFFNGVEPRFRTLTPTMKTVFGALSVLVRTRCAD